jgi:hypothetical protein
VGIKNKRIFWKGETLRVTGNENGLAVIAVCPRRNKWALFKFLNPGNFLTLTVLDLSNFAWEDGW